MAAHLNTLLLKLGFDAGIDGTGWFMIATVPGHRAGPHLPGKLRHDLSGIALTSQKWYPVGTESLFQ